MKLMAAIISLGLAASLIPAAYPAKATADPSRVSITPGNAEESSRPQEIMRGVVTFVDEPNDRITLRLSSNDSTDLKVGDGLLFNALRYGDHVKVTIENIDGARTIVGLTQE